MLIFPRDSPRGKNNSVQREARDEVGAVINGAAKIIWSSPQPTLLPVCVSRLAVAVGFLL